jgi:hypothetical protein
MKLAKKNLQRRLACVISCLEAVVVLQKMMLHQIQKAKNQRSSQQHVKTLQMSNSSAVKIQAQSRGKQQRQRHRNRQKNISLEATCFVQTSLEQAMFLKSTIRLKPVMHKDGESTSNGTATKSYRVVDSLAMIPMVVSDKKGDPRLPGRVVFVKEKATETLLNVREAVLDMMESRTFAFDIPKEKLCIDITVNIVSHGMPDHPPGRLVAMLYNLPVTTEQFTDEDGIVKKKLVSKGPPKPCGCVSVEDQQDDCRGTVRATTIVHRPVGIPLSKDYTYQVVVGCSTKAVLSVGASCSLVEHAEVVVEKAVAKMKKWQSLLPKSKKEVCTLKESMRTQERNLRLVEQKAKESEKELNTMQEKTKCLTNLLDEDQQTLALNGTERLRLLDTINHMKNNITMGFTAFTNRKQEIYDTKATLGKVTILCQKRQNEVCELEKNITWALENIPKAVVALLGDQQ